jgi:CBS domain-containing protein
MDRRVSELLKHKGSDIVSIQGDALVVDAVHTMMRLRIGSLVVMEGQLRPVGIITERDVLRRVVDMGLPPETTRVADIMSSPPITIAANTTAVEAMRVMTDHRVRHLPVIDENVMVGLISIGDVMKCITECLEQDIEQLEEYITGRPATHA